MSKIGHSIKKRSKANDVFITPLELAKNHIQMIEYEESDIWYDPFKNSGNYYNQFPNDNKVWSEILEGEDFFDFNMEVDIICSNPMPSCIYWPDRTICISNIPYYTFSRIGCILMRKLSLPTI